MVYIFLSYNSLLLPISLACFFSEEEQSLGGIENLKKKKKRLKIRNLLFHQNKIIFLHVNKGQFEEWFLLLLLD